MRIRIRLTDSSRQTVVARLHSAYQNGRLRLVKRIHAIFAIVAGESVTAVAELLHLGEQTVRDYVCAFIGKGVDSLSYKRPSGRPPKLTKTQRKELADLITAGPEACEKPEQSARPISHWSGREIADEILKRGIVAQISPRHAARLLKRGTLSRT